MRNKNIFGFVALAVAMGITFTSCNSEESPGWEYMPDMYRGPALEAYEPYDRDEDNLSAKEPAQGSIPRGFMAYKSYPATQAGYDDAKVNLTMPDRIPTDSIALSDGAKLYGIYCEMCHGEKGAGQGTLVKQGKFLGVPSYADREITPGSIFHVVTYGKGVMGSHASQVTPEERWLLSQHVLNLRKDLKGGGSEEETKGEESESTSEEGAPTDSTNTKG